MSPEDYLRAFFEWVKTFAKDHDNITVNDVNLVIISEDESNTFVQQAGGGAYVPSTYKPMLVTIMNRSIEGAPIVAGQTILAKAYSKIETDAASRLWRAMIVFHEFGHALGHPNRKNWGEKPEERAWIYELRTLRQAHESGTLAGWGISAAMIKDALRMRRPTYDKDYTSAEGQRQAIALYDSFLTSLG